MPTLLDRDGLPVPTPNKFILSRRGLSVNTLIRNLRELSVFYRWLDQEGIDLWNRMQCDQAFSEADIRGRLVEKLRRDQTQGRAVKKIAVIPNTFNQRLVTVRQSMGWCFNRHLSTMPFSDETYERSKDQKKRVLTWLEVV